MSVFKRVFLMIFLIMTVGLDIGPAQKTGEGKPVVPAYADEPLKYVGSVQTDRCYFDGAIRHVVGVHHYQVLRANRTHPPEGGGIGWTYNHQPYLAYWNGKFYLQYLSGEYQEHTPPTRILICTSQDGRIWSDPQVVFPEYELPEIVTDLGIMPAGTKSVMHQRMGFYVAPGGRLLTLGFYSFCISPRYSPNTGKGVGRVVREIRPDGSLGPVYFIRYNRHAGFSEENTSYPFYKTSQDTGFVNACDALLRDKLMTLQWWEEDRGTDGFYTIDPSEVGDRSHDVGEKTTSGGAGKALCYFHRPDGVVVGIWKNQWSALSPDDGQTWTSLVQNSTLMTCGAKVWMQSTADGHYALIYNHSLTRRNRFPLVIMPSGDGHLLQDMLCWQGEVPPKRYQGIHKNPGSQYIRGIMEGNGDPPGPFMWNTYSMNKEDIWVARTTVPVRGTVEEDVNETFDSRRDESDLESWNLYMPRWAPVRIGNEKERTGRFLELMDEEPYDYALAERAFPLSGMVEIKFRIKVPEITRGHALEIEVVNAQGRRPMRLRLDGTSLGMDIAKTPVPDPLPLSMNQWHLVTLTLDCNKSNYDIDLDGKVRETNIPFAEKVESLERMVFRTGPYRGEVMATTAERGADNPAGLDTEDLPGAEERVPLCRYWIDDLQIRKMDGSRGN